VRKVKTAEIPLINCYAFVYISKSEYKQILLTPYVFGFVKTGDRIVSIPEREILLMKRVVGEKTNIRFEPTKWNTGDKVEVIGGNLTGMRGTLLRRNGKTEFIVELKTIGFQMHMLIEDQYLQKVAEESLSMKS